MTTARLTTLTHLFLPKHLPGEDPPLSQGKARAYYPDGVLIDREWSAAMMEVFAVKREQGFTLSRYSIFRTRDVTAEVSTTYLGLDMSGGSGLACFWETFVFSDFPGLDGQCWRYATQNAAYHGHRMIVALLRETLHVDPLPHDHM